MAVTWFIYPERPKAELVLFDPYTFTEFEDAMLAVLELPALPEDLRIFIDRRSAGPPNSNFVKRMLDFFRAQETRLAGTRAAILISDSEAAPLADLRVGRFRIRTFQDAADAAHWLHPDAGDQSSDRNAAMRHHKSRCVKISAGNPSKDDG
jgi:hypothetical protein